MRKLNLGAGATAIEGYEPRDALRGDTIFPLPDADASADEIRASHVLEHFPHADVPKVIGDWVRVLKPGGTLKLAVPDFGWLAAQYNAGAAHNYQGYLMGGQQDADDYHGAIFDETALRAQLQAAGLISLRRWTSEADDCAALPVSLNLAATKPPAMWPSVSAVISMPRLGFNDFWACAFQEFGALGIPLRKVTGAYWDRDLTHGMEGALADTDPEWILTCDYDTVFTREQVRDLLSLAVRYPHADAIAPLQTARHHDSPLFTIRQPDGKVMQHVEREQLVRGEIIKAETAHFGLTLLRASKLKALRKPWFERLHDPRGGYGPEGCDPDVNFWRQWKAAGNTLYVALRVPVGHCELMVRWPDTNLEATFQRPSDFWKDGAPTDLWR